MASLTDRPAAASDANPGALVLSGCWTARGLGNIERRLVSRPDQVIDGAGIEALDTAGAWVLQKLLRRSPADRPRHVRNLRPEFTAFLATIAEQAGGLVPAPPREEAAASPVADLGRAAAATWEQVTGLFAFVGECAFALARCCARPARFRWRPVLYNLRSAGFDALPIVGLLSFLLGIVVAYQGASQLRQYGANIFVADLVGLSMLREFAPLITAIIIAGRSGSAYAAQIGTMAVTEEIDALRTIGIRPLELLVLPKVFALLIALPLLTVFADLLGVGGGMIMAHGQLGVGYGEFIDRFTLAVDPTSYLIGIGKAPVFAVIIAVIGCFQGFRTRGGADSVGRQTTRSVVQATFLVIVADALFSIVFSALDL